MELAQRVTGLLADIEAGHVQLVPRADPDEVYAGDVTYDTDNGWVVVVFNDCNGWDYLDSVIDPNGEELEFFGMPDSLQNYRPPEAVAVTAYGFPSKDFLAQRAKGRNS